MIVVFFIQALPCDWRGDRQYFENIALGSTSTMLCSQINQKSYANANQVENEGEEQAE